MNIPQPVKIKTEDPLIVDLTEQEDVVGQWDANIQKLFIKGFVGDEYWLDKLMKEYIRSLQEEAIHFKDYLEVKAKLLNHIKYFHLYQTELNCRFIEKYLENMEDILKQYCDLEVDVLTGTRKQLGNKNKKRFNKIVNDVFKHMIYMFQVYLLNKEDHILNVLIKVNMNPFPKECNLLWTKIYIHYFKNKPMDLSDEAFCRAYIIYQRWKEFYPKKFHKLLNSTLFSRYERTEDSIYESETLKRILMPRSDSTLDAISHISGQVYCMSNEYFKYIRSKIDIDPNVNLIDDEDINVPVLDFDDEDDVDFLNEYNNVLMNMASLNDQVGESFEDDDDVQIISVTLNDSPKTKEKQPTIIDLIDDEDTPVVVNKPSKKPLMTTKFLDSIVVPDKPRKTYRKRTRNLSAEKEDSQEFLYSVPSVSPCPSTLLSYTTCLTTTSPQSNPVYIGSPTKTKDCTSSAASNKLVSLKSACTNSARASNETKAKSNSSNPNSSTCVYEYGIVTPPTLQDDKDHDPCTSKSKDGGRQGDTIKENKDVYVTSYVHKGHGYYLKEDCLASGIFDRESSLSPPLELEYGKRRDDRQISPKKVEPDILPNTKKKDENMHNMDLVDNDLLYGDDHLDNNHNDSDESEDELLRSFVEDEFEGNIDIEEHELIISRPDNVKKNSSSFSIEDSQDNDTSSKNVCFEQDINNCDTEILENCTEVIKDKVSTSEIKSISTLNGAKQGNATSDNNRINRVSENICNVSENNNKLNSSRTPSNIIHTIKQQENQQIGSICIDETPNTRNSSPTNPEAKILHSQKSHLGKQPSTSLSDFDEFQKSIWASVIATNSSPSAESQLLDSGPISPTDLTSPSYERLRNEIRFEFTKTKFEQKNNGIAAESSPKPLQTVLKKKSCVTFDLNEMDPIYSLLFDQSSIEDTKTISINCEPYQKLQLEKAILYEEFIKENKKECGQIMMMFNYDEVNDGNQGSYKYGRVNNDGKRKRNMAGNSSRDYEEHISKPKRKPRGKRKTILSA